MFGERKKNSSLTDEKSESARKMEPREVKKMESGRMPEKAVVNAGRILCPYCGGFIGRAYYGAYSGNVELKCVNGRCKKFYRLEL